MNDRVLSGNFHTHIYINTQLLPSPSSFEPLRPLKTRPPTLPPFPSSFIAGTAGTGGVSRRRC